MDILALLVVLLATLSLYFTASLLSFARDLKDVVRLQTLTRPRQPPVYEPADDSFSYVGMNYPKLYPLKGLKPISMPVEESVHYPLLAPEAPLEYLWTAPVGDNHVRLGPTHRFFAVAMFHQIHCLRGMRDAMEGNGMHHGSHAEGHLHHCMNYVRQWTLCDADTTLERGDYRTRNFELERVGAMHSCVDWEPIYEDVRLRWHEWQAYKKEHGLA